MTIRTFGSNGLRFAMLSLVIEASTTGVFGATIHIPADQPTIQAGINAAMGGDTVLVFPGTYVENINFNGKAILVKSVNGVKVTIIDGGMNGSVVTFNSAETVSSILSGFTIQNGTGTLSSGFTEGGGVEVSSASPTVSRNVITKNQACAGGGILITNGGSPVIRENLIIQNSGGTCAGLGGGGIAILGGGAPQIVANTISNNSECCADGGGIYMNYTTGMPVIADNMITGNVSGGTGGGIFADNQVDANVIQNVIARNSAGAGAGIYWSVPENTRGPFLVNNTVVSNKLTQSCPLCQGSALYIGGFYSTSRLTNNLFVGAESETALYCDTTYGAPLPITDSNDAFSSSGSGYAGGCSVKLGIAGNISTDPQFVNAVRGMYELKAGSPAIDAGVNFPGLPKKDIAGNPRIVDGDGDGMTIVDMGAYEFQP